MECASPAPMDKSSLETNVKVVPPSKFTRMATANPVHKGKYQTLASATHAHLERPLVARMERNVLLVQTAKPHTEMAFALPVHLVSQALEDHVTLQLGAQIQMHATIIHSLQ